MGNQLRKRIIAGLAERVVSLRRGAGLSQQVFATRAQISTNRLRDVETYGAATTETLNRIARVLSIPVDDLLGHKSPVSCEPSARGSTS